VELDVPTSFLGKTVRVYYDGGNGTIDFGKAIADATAEVIVTVFIQGYGNLDINDYGNIDIDTWGDIALDDTTGASRIKLTITRRLANGTYRFALVNYSTADNYHRPYVVTKTIATRPDEAEPYVVAYDADADELTVSAGPNESSGYTYKVYAAAWGANPGAIDFDTPIATAATSPLVLVGVRGATVSGTRYLVVRKTAGTVEEKNTNVVAFTVANGDWDGNVPAAPTSLGASILASNAVRLRWEYTVAGIVPDGFRVYSGTSGVDYGTVIATVPYDGKGIITKDLDPIAVATKFAVRAYRGGDEEQNVEYTAISPLTLPAEVTGTGTTTWKDS
jgi:hypothetical protein